MKQKYTSKDTSINSKKRPAIYGKLQRARVFAQPVLPRVLDFGCGKHFESYNLGDNVRGYDPFNYPHTENLVGGYDFVLSSNVLNVVAERDVRVSILQAMKNQLAPSGVVFVTVYEGNKSGVGRVTKRDCWQENRRLRSYADEASEVFSDVSFAKGMMICKA